MKARADDRRLFNEPIKLNVLALKSTGHLNVAQLWRQLDLNRESQRGTSHSVFEDEPADLNSVMDDLQYQRLNQVLALFAHAETFGSLIQMPQEQADSLKELLVQLEDLAVQGDTFQKSAAATLRPFVQQAWLLAQQYDAVVANPPYMGSKFYDRSLKKFVDANYKFSKGDLYTCFIVRNAIFAKSNGLVGMLTIPNWMFISTFEELRDWLFNQTTIETFLHNGRGVFGSDFGSCAFTFRKHSLNNFKGTYKRLFDKQGSVASNEEISKRFINVESYLASSDDFRNIPGSPVAYWASKQVINSFFGKKVLDISISEGQNKTSDNAKFVRLWWEIKYNDIGRSKKWLTYAKGGDYRRWYGNLDYVVDWSDNARAHYRKDQSCRIIAEHLWYKPGISWTLLTAASQSFRLLPENATFDMTGSSIFLKSDSDLSFTLSLFNSCVAANFLKILNPTVALQVRDVRNIPIVDLKQDNRLKICLNGEKLIELSCFDWNSYETSFDFSKNQIINAEQKNLKLSFFDWLNKSQNSIELTQGIEEENNRLFIDAYGLQDELSPEVPEDQITLTRADREKDSQRLISYAIGCMMGRYSLDEPGLIYAHAGNNGFDPERYRSFPADADGIVPITDELWFSDDAAHRIREFLGAVWGAESLEENSAWLAESLGQKSNETADQTLRRYLASNFYKDHLQTYKKRPIYWLFSSGKQGAFQALVYLHRYNESTLARMRAEYVVPLTGKIQTRLDLLKKDAEAATAPATRNKLNKDIEKLNKKHTELLAYDEKLRHYADLRISLDLDDGVKVNYGKFGDLLAEVKAVTGGASDD